MKTRKIRTMIIALTLSALSSAFALSIYLLPDETMSFANRVQDYVVHNEALFRFEDIGLFKTLHIQTVEVDKENTDLRLIKIDENSLAEPGKTPDKGGFGQFPWPRAKHGELVNLLKKAGAKVVAFDILFPENSSLGRSDDEKFAAAMRGFPIVLSYQMADQGSKISVADDFKNAVKRSGFVTVDTPGGWLLYQFLTASFEADTGAVDKRVSMAAAAVEEYTGKKFSDIKLADGSDDKWHARFGDKIVPLDGSRHFLMLPFKPVETIELSARSGATNQNLSFAQSIGEVDVFRMDPATLSAFAKDKLIVVGPTAGGLGDFIVTPEGRFPAVFANVRFMDQLLAGKFISRVPMWIDIAMIIALPILIGFLMTQLSAITGIALSMGLILIFSLVSILLYATDLKWLDLLHIDGGMFLSALAVALYRVFTEGADKRQIRDLFGKHVSPEIVNEMINADDPTGALSLKGKRAKVTVFYSDIRGFTAMSERMTPEEIYNQLNEYFEDMCNIIFQYGGYVDKFIGDCVMAVFSAPNPRPDDAMRAVISAIRQQQKIAQISAAWEKQGKQIFTVGMGINTGEVVMGNLGSSDRMNYTVIGDNVNTAARLYNVAEGGQTIISESTFEEVKDVVIVNELQPILVKGKVLPLRVFEIVGLKDELPPGTESKMWTGSQEALWSGKH